MLLKAYYTRLSYELTVKFVNESGEEMLPSVSGEYKFEEEYEVEVPEIEEMQPIDQIIQKFGEPKITTDSCFGGHAYTFYTDNNYSWRLYQ